jgi:hypothetical protein
MNNEVPVKYNGVVVGYTIDDGKSIKFNDGVAENTIKDLLSRNKTICVSARAIGEVKDDNTVEKTENISYDIFVVDKLTLNISSEFSGWIASLLKRGLMEHKTSYGNLIPVPDEVVNFVKEFYNQKNDE